MYKPYRRQKSFYDAVYEANIPDNHILKHLEKVIKWSRFKQYLKKHYHDRGRDAYNPLMMFKLLVLQFLFNLSDRQLEEQVRDRISFRWFIGLDPMDAPPDHTAYGRFRDRLGAETIKRLLDDIVQQGREQGYVLDALSVVDATEIAAKVDTFRMRERSKRNGAADPTDSSPDPDASYGHKNKNKPFYGYKCHMSMDGDTRIITRLEASPGDEHDGGFFSAVHDPPAEGVTADKAYDSGANFELIEEYGQRAAIIPRKLRGKKREHIKKRYPSAAEQQYYRKAKRKRPRIEPKFAEMKKFHGMERARYWGLDKMRVQVFLTGIVVNLKRMVTLMTGTPRWKLAEARGSSG